MADNIDELMLSVLTDINKNIEIQTNRQTQDRRRAMSSVSRKITGGLSVAGVLSFVKNTIELEASMDRLSKQFGMSASQLLVMERASSRFGTSMTRTLSGLQQTFAGVGMENISSLVEPLARYGVNVRPLIDLARSDDANPMDILREIQSQWGGLNTRQRVRVGQTLGFDQGMLNAMNDPNTFNQYIQSQHMSPAEADAQIAKAKEAKVAFDNMGLTLQNLATKIVNKGIPALESVVEVIGRIADFYDKLEDITNLFGGDDKEDPKELSPDLQRYNQITKDLQQKKMEIFNFENHVKRFKEQGDIQAATKLTEGALSYSISKYYSLLSDKYEMDAKKASGKDKDKYLDYQYAAKQISEAPGEISASRNELIRETAPTAIGDIYINIDSPHPNAVAKELESHLTEVLKRAVHNAKGGS